MSTLIGGLVAVIILLILMGLAWWAIQQILPLIQPYISEPFFTLIRVLCVVILVLVVLWVVVMLLGMAGVKVPSPFRF